MHEATCVKFQSQYLLTQFISSDKVVTTACIWVQFHVCEELNLQSMKDNQLCLR